MCQQSKLREIVWRIFGVYEAGVMKAGHQENEHLEKQNNEACHWDGKGSKNNKAKPSERKKGFRLRTLVLSANCVQFQYPSASEAGKAWHVSKLICMKRIPDQSPSMVREHLQVHILPDLLPRMGIDIMKTAAKGTACC